MTLPLGYPHFVVNTAEIIVINELSDGEYFSNLTRAQRERCVSKIEFIEESGYYGNFKTKAFNIWYAITKLHLLPDGNKRMAFACFLVHCLYAGKRPRVALSDDNFEKIALDIAKSNPDDKEEVLEQLGQRVTFIALK